jgi:multidrug efflux pump subunit AcrA (membrane-fusion protein)
VVTRRTWRPRSKVKTALVGAAVVAVAVGGTVGGLALTSSSGPQYVSVPATTGSVVQTTSLTGTIAPVTEVNLNFATSGTVASVTAKVGESVKAGQILATLQTSDLSSQVDQSEGSLDNAESSLATAQSPASSVIAIDEQSVSSDRTTLSSDELTMNDDASTDELSLTSAQEAVASAQNAYTSAALQMSNDQSALSAAQSKEAIDCAGDGVASGACASDQTTVSTDENQVAQDKSGDASADAAVQSAEVSLSETQLKNTQTSRQDAQKVAADRVQLTKDLSSLSGAEDGQYVDQVGSDEMAVDSAKNAVETAEQNLADARLISPISGTVTAVNVTAGASAQAGASTTGTSSGDSTAAVEIENPSTFDVDTTASSRQVSELKVGDQVTITPTGATTPSTGTVVSISTIATISSGVASFPVTIGVTGKPTDMYDGATADLTVAILDVKNVLTVPTSAVQTVGTRSFVEILSHGQEIRHTVVVGAVGGVLTQIKAGLTAGEKVVIADLSASLPGSNPSKGAGFPGTHIQFIGPGGQSGIVTKNSAVGGS